MLMIPPAGGDSFTGNSGANYSSAGQEVEVGPGDVAEANARGWSYQPYGVTGNPDNVSRWFNVGANLLYSDFTAAATTKTVPLFLLAPHAILEGIKIKHSVAFGGGSISAYTISVGNVGNPSVYASAFDVFQAVGSRAYQLSQNFAGEDGTVATQIYATATSTGGNLSTATSGTVNIWAKISVDL